jgi:hypothetical protein
MPEVWTSQGVEWREIEPFDPETAPLPAPAVWWKRLPLVRHIRWLHHRIGMATHYELWAQLGRLPAYASYDERCLSAIWRGDL